MCIAAPQSQAFPSSRSKTKLEQQICENTGPIDAYRKSNNVSFPQHAHISPLVALRQSRISSKQPKSARSLKIGSY